MVLMIAALVIFFTGCSDSDDGGEEPDGVISVPAGTTHYFSFANGLKQSKAIANADAGNQNWDIAFTQGRVILTNSGNTATNLSSGGAGGVCYSGKTDFDDVASADADFSGDYKVDTNRYVNASASAGQPTGAGMPTTVNPLNVMTYIGYGFGDGLGDGSNYGTDGHAPFASYQYNANAFYSMVSQGVYDPTYKVYIIKHGTGSGLTKIQITSMESPAGTSGPRVYTCKYETLP
jgi:hypothetical protein